MGNCCSSREGKDIESIWFKDFENTLASMEGKRIAITGTTTGTGYVAALTCARKGAEVVMLNRPSERADEAEKKIKEECPLARVHTIPCDLADFASVKAAKEAFLTKFEGIFSGTPALDVLCCNAGVMAFPDVATKDGFDIQMQTNHLSHFLLVKELFPSLEAAAQASGEARIVNHSSGARHGTPLDAAFFQKAGGSLGGDGRSARSERYHHTKLANVAFTYALEARLKKADKPKIKAVVVTPGIADTALVPSMIESGISFGGVLGCLVKCLGPYMLQSAEDGTMPLLLGIGGSEVESGDLITPSKGLWRVPKEMWGPPAIFKRPLPFPEKSAVCEEESAQQLVWEESEKAIGEHFNI